LGYEEEKKPEWVENFLLPQLKSETGLSWKRAGGQLLHSEECFIFLPEQVDEKLYWKEICKENPAIESFRKLYPVIDEDDMGYFLRDSSGPNKKRIWKYSGFWAFNIERIHKRGTLVGKKFGL
jgi:hypothetical protein